MMTLIMVITKMLKMVILTTTTRTFDNDARYLEKCVPEKGQARLDLCWHNTFYTFQCFPIMIVTLIVMIYI